MKKEKAKRVQAGEFFGRGIILTEELGAGRTEFYITFV